MANSAVEPLAARPPPVHLPDELASLLLSFLQRPQLLVAAQVQRQWRDLHGADEYWCPHYRLAYGDSLRLNERRDWKWNFRARDRMLCKLGPVIAQLAHPDRDQRAESVAFLRAHCELLKFMLDPPPELIEADAPGTAAAAGTEEAQVPLLQHPAALPVAVPVHLDSPQSNAAALPVAMAVAPGPHPADAAHVAAVAAPVPVPTAGGIHRPEQLARMFGRPFPPPPPFSSAGRPALPARHSLEFQHAQNLVKDALVTQGWRKLYPLLVPPSSVPRRNHMPTVLLGSDGTSLPHSSSSFPFAAAASTAAAAAAESRTATATAAVASVDDDEHMSDVHSPTLSPASQHADGDGFYRTPFPDANRAIEYGATLLAWTESPWLRFDAVSRALDDIALLVLVRMEALVSEIAVTPPAHSTFAAGTNSPVSAAAASSSSSAAVTHLPLHLRLQALHHVLYTQLGFHGNETRYYDVRNSMIHLVLCERTGIPISLAVVYMAVATRVGIHAQGVNSPGHFLLRVTDAHAPANAHSPLTADAGKQMGGTPNDSSSRSSSSSNSVYFIDAFSGNTMSPSVALNFLSMFGGGGAGGAGLSDATLLSQLQPCSAAHIFVRMYRNLLNLYQRPRPPPTTPTPGQRAGHSQQRGSSRSDASVAYYTMEASLHHCASQILELLRLGGEAVPDVATAIFIDRFKFCGAMS